MERLFPCTQCTSKFETSDYLKQHVRMKHPAPSSRTLREQIAKPASPPKQYPCEQCDKSYQSAGARSQHVARVHGVIIWKCYICLKNLSSKDNLRRHIENCQKKHNTNPRIDLSPAPKDVNHPSDKKSDDDEIPESIVSQDRPATTYSDHDKDSNLSTSSQPRQQKRSRAPEIDSSFAVSELVAKQNLEASKSGSSLVSREKSTTSGEGQEDSSSSGSESIDDNQPGPSNRLPKKHKKHWLNEALGSTANLSPLVAKVTAPESPPTRITRRQVTSFNEHDADKQAGIIQEEQQHECCHLTADEARFNSENIDCLGSEECYIPVGGVYMKEAVPTAEEPECFCIACFKKMKLKPADFEQTTNSNPDSEQSVNCTSCKDLYHTICAGYLPQLHQEFICDRCGDMDHIKSTVDGEEKTPFDIQLEDTANNILKEIIGKKPVHNRVSVISFLTKSDVTYSELYPVELLSKADMTQTITYYTRSIYVFQRLDGVDVPLMIFYSQEYPHCKTTMLDYLDTVPFAEPRLFKRPLVEGLVVEYWKYMRNRGYTNGHLWAKAPRQDESFIYHIHPKTQKYLSQEELQNWYIGLFELGIHKKVIESWRAFEEERNIQMYIDPLSLPIYNHSLWHGELHKSVEKLQRWIKSPKLRTKIMEYLKNKVFPQHLHDNYFITFKEPAATLEIEEEKRHSIMGDRMLFNAALSKNNWEFNTLRRAKYSSLATINLLLPQI